MKSAIETEKLNRKQKVTATIDKEQAANVESNMNLAETEIAAEKAIITAKEGAKVLGGIEHGREDSDQKKFEMYAKGVMDYTAKAKKSDWDSMSLLTNMSLNRYNGAKGTFGFGMDRPTGEERNHEEAEQALSGLMDIFVDTMSDSERAVKAYEAQQRKILANLKDWKSLEALDKGTSSITSKKKTADPNNSLLVKELKTMQTSLSNATSGIGTVANNINKTTKAVSDTVTATKKVASATENQTIYDKIENSAERVADSQEGKHNQEIIKNLDTDLSTGFNTDAKANELISTLSGFENIKETMCPCEAILQSILAEVQIISKNGINVKNEAKNQNKTGAIGNLPVPISEVEDRTQKDTRPIIKFGVSEFSEQMKYAGATLKSLTSKINEEVNQDIIKHVSDLQDRAKSDVWRSTVTTTVKDPHSWVTKLKDSFADLTKTTANYKVIMSKTSEEQDKMSAELVKRFGLVRGKDATGQGDKISIARRLSLFRGKDKFKDLFGDINLSEGVKVDTTAITDKLAKVLSGSEMFKAQTGGWKNNLMAAGTGGLAYLWQPSLEKTRAQAEGLNTIMADIRAAANKILQDIQDKESKLSGLKASGDLKLGTDGKVLDSSTTEAKALVLSLEQSKQSLASVLADVGVVDQVVGRTHGKISEIIKQLGFTSPILRKDNSILANINAGLDKTGRALKYQTRAAELLNYSFQLMGRHIGQLFKRLMLILNPINLIKRAFSDFASYDTKWQRTMNVIKYNLRRILRPFMEWLAQQLVNILGVINAIIKGIGQAFGKDWDLFDQSAASAEKTREELEKINVTASFDELHDIGSESNEVAENDLSGDIYKPQWGDLYDTITEKAKAITEKLIPIFKKLGDILKWCLDHWQLLVAAWAAFKVAKGLWRLLDWAGGLKAAFAGLKWTKLLDLLSTLSIIAGVVWGIKTTWDTIKWGENYYGMNPDEREQQGKKNVKNGEITGALLGAGIGSKLGSAFGIPGKLAGAAIGAMIGDGMGEAAIATFQNVFAIWHGDTPEIKRNSTKAGEGIGKTIGTAAGAGAGIAGAAAIGAALGTSVGPVGTAVGAVLGAAIGWAAGGALGKGVGAMFGDLTVGIQNITRGKGDFQKLRVTLEDVENATINVNDKTKLYNEALKELQSLEKQTGENGKELYDVVESGTKSYDDLTKSQQKVYDQYKKLQEIEKNLFVAKQERLKISSKYQEQLGKESGDFTNYIKTMQDGMNDGIISQEAMYDRFAQTYGSLDADSKKVFAEQLPAYMRTTIKDQGAEYETFGNKVSKTFSDMGKRIADNNKSVVTSVKNGWETGGIIGAVKGAFEGVDTWFAKSSNGLKLVGATEDDVKASTEALAQAQEQENKLQQEVDELQQKTKSSAEELYNKLNEGSITYKSLTKDQQTLVNKYAEWQEAMVNTDEKVKKNVENIASLDLQTATTTGNYDTFINNLMAANERGEISTDEMYQLMAQAYANMDQSTRESLESQMTEHGLMVETVRTKSGEYLGIMGNLKKNVGNAWTDIKNGVKEKVKDFTTDAKDKFEDLKTKAGEKWETIKTTITDKVSDIWTNVTSKFEDLKGALSRKWEEIKTAASQGWENIKTAIWNWVKSLWDSITKVFENIGKAAQDLWQRVCNFFSGKGFKTNEQVEADGNRNVSIQPYAIGTNFVPNDGLAYLHKGEAVIPAKYNTPYQLPNNRNLEESINQLNKQVSQIGETINQGIRVQGQFVQKGTDLVASVEKTNNRLSNNILNNKVYAR